MGNCTGELKDKKIRRFCYNVKKVCELRIYILKICLFVVIDGAEAKVHEIARAKVYEVLILYHFSLLNVCQNLVNYAPVNSLARLAAQ